MHLYVLVASPATLQNPLTSAAGQLAWAMASTGTQQKMKRLQTLLHLGPL
jgi:hypothetical protein